MPDDDCCEDDGNWLNSRREGGGGEIERGGGITSIDEVLECLTSSRRRSILYHMQDNEVEDIDELATQVAAWEDAVAPEKVTADNRKRVETQLVHTHLPKLADAQFVEYDRRSDTVRYREPPRLLYTVLQLLARLEGKTDEWPSPLSPL